jgi:hypothetical protein
MGLTDDPTCERCLEEDESATHIVCDCEAIANLRFRHLGQFFMEPTDYYDAPINSPTFHSKCRINKGLIKRGSTIDHWRSRCKGRISGPPLVHTYIHNIDEQKALISKNIIVRLSEFTGIGKCGLSPVYFIFTLWNIVVKMCTARFNIE